MFQRSTSIIAQFNNILSSRLERGIASLSTAFSIMLLYLRERGLEYVTNKYFATFIAYDQAVAVGATTISLFNTNYPQSEHFLVKGIRFFTGANAALGATDWALGITDAALKNATVSIVNSNSTVLKNFPLTEFIASTNNADMSASYIEFSSPIMWIAQTNLQVIINVPTASATANLNIRCELIGDKFI